MRTHWLRRTTKDSPKTRRICQLFSHKVDLFKPEIISRPHLVTAENELLVPEDLGDLWTDEKTLFGFCPTDYWEVLLEVPKRRPCLIHSLDKVLRQSQFDVQRRQQNVAGFYQR